MSKKSPKVTRTRIIYPKEVEAAWFVLKNFINPLDCSEKVDGDVLPMNQNPKLACIYSGYDYWSKDKDPLRPSYFSKARLFDHLNRQSTYYYRSHYKASYKEGYGSTDKQAQSLSFAKDLNINHKVNIHPSLNVMLLGIDLDVHKGETDVLEVQEWLQREYFKDSHWEPSTGLKGRHGYVKILYNSDSSHSYIFSLIKELFTLLNKKRELLGFEAPVDKPCGLPSHVSLSDKNPYPDYPVKTIDDRYISYYRSQCLKIPRFNNNSEYIFSFGDIISFHTLRYYSFQNIKNILNDLKQELHLGKKEEDIKKEEEELLTIVCSPPVNVFSDNHPQSSKIVDLSNYWHDKKKTFYGKENIYEQRIEECREIQDTMEKTRKFYWYYSLRSKEVPSVEDAIDEYIKQNLNTNANISSTKRYARFQSCRKFIAERFDLSKTGFNLDDWEEVKEGYIRQMDDAVDGKKLYWNKDAKKKYSLKTEELALVYYAVKKSGEYDRNNRDKLIKNSFSYGMLQQLFRVIHDKSCHRAKSARILKLLQESGLIVKKGNYIPGVRGNCYVVAEIYQLFDRADILEDWMNDMSTDEFLESICA